MPCREVFFMSKYLIKRILLAIVSVFIVCVITFFAMNAIPGGPFNSEKALSPAIEKALMERYNLDKPVWQQYLTYLWNLLHGDLGTSMAKSGRSVFNIIRDTIFIGICFIIYFFCSWQSCYIYAIYHYFLCFNISDLSKFTTKQNSNDTGLACKDILCKVSILDGIMLKN